MKVLFLDIDGVVNCSSTHFDSELYPLDKYKAFLVGKIKLDTNCNVVLSSSWRHHPEGVAAVEKRIVKVLDTTKSVGEIRGDEIKEWLDRHPEVTRYAILDDDSDMLDEQLTNFFKTTWQEGLTDEIAKQVIEHLNS